MKKKIIILCGSLIAALVIVFSTFSANAEGVGGGGLANRCCPIWDITYTYNLTLGDLGMVVTCTTGGSYQCKDCTCPDTQAPINID